MMTVRVVLMAIALGSASAVGGELRFDSLEGKLAGSAPAPSTAGAGEPSSGEPTDAPEVLVWGRPGPWWGAVTAGYARSISGPGDSNDGNLAFTFSTFLATRFELMVELGGWYFNQDGDDAVGANASLLFRWHFLTFGERDAWTIFGDAGAGLLGTTDTVPPGGTGFNFTPKAGVGFTHRLGDSDHRLIVGIRWHHISNARIEGEMRNPGRDGIFIYGGVQFPF